MPGWQEGLVSPQMCVARSEGRGDERWRLAWPCLPRSRATDGGLRGSHAWNGPSARQGLAAGERA